MQSFLEEYGDRRLADLLADDVPVAATASELPWLEPPPTALAAFLEDRPDRISPAAVRLDASPFLPTEHRREATYSLIQMHRLWITTRVLERHCPPDAFVVDLGAFPFALETVLREFRQFRGRLLGTVNLPLEAGWANELAARSIECATLDLDPLVHDPGAAVQPRRLDLPDESADVVVFAHVIEHLYHPMMALTEAARLLKPGGRLIISTDNAQRLDALLRMLWRNEFLYDPIEHTSAMAFHFWRGHNRFFTAPDLHALVAQTGLSLLETEYFEVFYHAFSEKYFHRAIPTMPRWRAKLLTDLPGYRNEIVVVATKPLSSSE